MLHSFNTYYTLYNNLPLNVYVFVSLPLRYGGMLISMTVLVIPRLSPLFDEARSYDHHLSEESILGQ